METLIESVTKENIDGRIMEKAGEIIRSGGLVAFPTETVYGLGGDAFNPESSMKIYAAKGRPSDNPLIVHIAELKDLSKVAKDIPDEAFRLAEAFWPGPLTIILNKVDNLPKETTGGLETVAIRMPSHPIALEFIKASGGFIAAPSANISGRPSPTSARYVIEDLNGRVEMIIDGGSSDIGLESTIVDLTQSEPMILRPGFITREDLERVVNDVSIDAAIIDENSKEPPKAPGMKYRHYAPKADLLIVSGDSSKVVSYINECIKKGRAEENKVAVIATEETKELYEADVVKNLGKRQDEASIARNLFRILRELDDIEVDMIYTESFDSKGISMATMNRLLKAAGHKEVKL